MTDDDDRPLARATDPATSHYAAERAKRWIPTHIDCILGVLWRPMIPPEIAKCTGLTIEQIDRRRREMLDRDLVRLTGRVRDGYQEIEKVLPSVGILAGTNPKA